MAIRPIGAGLYVIGSMLVGFQLPAFGMFAKVFAITEGLLPEDPPVVPFVPIRHAPNRLATTTVGNQNLSVHLWTR